MNRACAIALALFACGSRTELDVRDAASGDAASGDATHASDVGTPDALLPDETGADASIITGWPRVWGGTAVDAAYAIAVGPDGSVVVAGTFQDSVDFDPTSGVDVHVSKGGNDVFVTKFTAGGGYVWTRTWGTTPTQARDDEAYAVAIAPDGSILVTGTFAAAADFDPGPGVDLHSPAGDDFSAYVTKLDSNGEHVWTRTWGSPARTSAWGVGVAPDGAVVVAGAFDEIVDLDPGPGTDAHASQGDLDAYVLELDASGAFVWGRTWGGSGTEENVGKLAIDAAGSVIVTGAFQSTVDFDPGPLVDDHTALGAWDLFVVELAKDGTLAWARTVDSSSGAALPTGVAVASDGSLAVSGFFYGSVAFGLNDVHTSGAQYSGFVTRLENDGTYAWAATWGGSVFDAQTGAEAVAIDGDGRVIVGGAFYKTVDFDPGPGVVSRSVSSGTTTDMYLLRLKAGGAFDAVETWGGAGYDAVMAVAAGQDLSIFAAGVFGDVVDFSTTGSPDARTAQGVWDAFALRWTP